MKNYLVSFLLLVSVWLTNSAPLDDFVAAPDPSYSWIDTGGTYSGVNEGGRWNAHVLNMTSQMWLNESYVNRPIWWHWVIVIVPEQVDNNDFAVVVGTGGSNNNYNQWPPQDEEYFRLSQYVATHVRCIVAIMYQIPNEPLLFWDDPLQKERSEDDIIAFGWKMFGTYPLNSTFRYNWVPHFPMAKAHIRAMDTVQAFIHQNYFFDITRFAVAGASKRGWSTWLTAAADSRVVAFVPMVMDMANLHPNLHHMYKAYGGWTFAFEPYYAENITKDLDDEWVQQLFDSCDPYSFFDRYEGVQKLIIDATNDEFFMPDDEYYWWQQFPEPRYFEMVPDAEHSLSTGIEQLVPTVATFIKSYLKEVDFPVVDWTIDYAGNGSITVTLTGNTTRVKKAVRFHGLSCTGKPSRRDFRIINLDDPCLCGAKVDTGEYCANAESLFFGTELTAISNNGNQIVFVAEPPEVPKDHWIAFFIAIQYEMFQTDILLPFGSLSKEQRRYKNYESGTIPDLFNEFGKAVFTTQVSIVPNIFPFPDCNGTSCYGTLV